MQQDTSGYRWKYYPGMPNKNHWFPSIVEHVPGFKPFGINSNKQKRYEDP